MFPNPFGNIMKDIRNKQLDCLQKFKKGDKVYYYSPTFDEVREGEYLNADFDSISHNVLIEDAYKEGEYITLLVGDGIISKKKATVNKYMNQLHKEREEKIKSDVEDAFNDGGIASENMVNRVECKMEDLVDKWNKCVNGVNRQTYISIGLSILAVVLAILL